MKLTIPYFSQLHDVADPEWQTRSCSIVNLKMALEFISAGDAPAIEALIAEGVAIGAYHENVGWSHDGIVRLARNHGVSTYAQEFRSVIVSPASGIMDSSEQLVEAGLLKLTNVLKSGKPVIVSVTPDFGSNKDNHTIMLIGSDERGFFYHNPHAEDPKRGKEQFVSKEDFVKFWRRLAIFFD